MLGRPKAVGGLFRAAFLAPLLAFATTVCGQSSFETDPFASRFREKADFSPKFRTPEKGGVIKIDVPPGEGGRLSLVSKSVGEAFAPPGALVLVEYQDLKLRARHVRVDHEAKTVMAEGDVVFEQGPSRMTGSRIDLDLNEKIGVVTDGGVDLEGGMHLKGARLAKVGPRSFTLTDGTLTACEGDHPAWLFRVKSARVTLEETARLKGVVFKLGGVPLLYTPYLVWPALRDRASGFLIPGVGYNQNRGAYLGLSYYWAISRSADATFSVDGYTKRFFGVGGELRLRPSAGTRAEGTYYTVHDPKEDRWRWKTRGTVIADDPAPNLRGVISWFDFSDTRFLDEFERDFNLTSTRSVKSEAFLTYAPDPFALNLRLGREEALYGGASSAITERRPVLEARLRPTPLLGQALFVEASAQAGLLRIDRGPNQPAGLYSRVDLLPRVTAPLSTIPWLSFQADLSGRLTSYEKSLSPSGTALLDDRYTRRSFRGGLEMTGPSFARLFDRKLGGFTRLKHVIEPRFEYSYQSDPGDLQRTPRFDEVDSLTPAHSLRYGLIQRLLGKGKQGAAREIASLEISRLYYFKLPGEGSPGQSSTLSRNAPIEAALRINTGANLNLDARSTYDTNASRLTSSSVSATLNYAERNLSLSLYDSRPVNAPTSTQLRFLGGLPIVPKRLRVDVQGVFDISKSKMLETRGLLTFEGSCFKILAEYREFRAGAVPTRDYRIALNLKNIGSFLDFTGSL